MTEYFAKTASVCPVCLKALDAYKTVGEDGFVYLEKTCPEHGHYKTLIWEGDLSDYLAWNQAPAGVIRPTGGAAVQKGCPYDCGLCEDHERNGCCVLLELTNRCNLRCPVCFASAGDAAPYDLSLAEIAVQYDMLMKRGGPFNIQLSGGEPTLRDDLPEIIALGHQKGFSYFQLNTNGVRIAREEGYARFLAESGVSCVFLQFDGLNDDIYRTLRGCDLTKTKLQAIEECQKAGLPVVLVPTVAPCINDHALGDILRFAVEHIPHIRGVHMQPISYFGRCSLTAPKRRLTIPRILKNIEEQTGGLMKAADFTGGGAESPYCSFHASYIQKSDGSLKPLPSRQTSGCCVPSSEARDFVALHWGSRPDEGGCCCGETAPALQDCCCETAPASDCCCEKTPEMQDCCETSSLDEFLRKTVQNTFTVSSMLFQDAENLDLERLRRCYLCEADTEKGMVPFCAYNLTDTSGKSLYRK